MLFPGGGLWQPDAQALTELRQVIDQNPARLKRVIADARLRKEFLGGASEKGAVKAFVKTRTNAESALKTKPKASRPLHIPSGQCVTHD